MDVGQKLVEGNEKLYLPISGPVLRKTWINPNILLREVTAVLNLLKMVHYSTRSISWRFSLAEISKSFCAGF